MEDRTVNNRDRVVFVLASAGVVALSAFSLSANAGPYGGRPVDQVRPSVSTTPEAHASRVLPSPYAYAGRRIDHPQAVVESRGLEQAELAALEERRPRYTDATFPTSAGASMPCHFTDRRRLDNC